MVDSDIQASPPYLNFHRVGAERQAADSSSPFPSVHAVQPNASVTDDDLSKSEVMFAAPRAIRKSNKLRGIACAASLNGSCLKCELSYSSGVKQNHAVTI